MCHPTELALINAHPDDSREIGIHRSHTDVRQPEKAAVHAMLLERWSNKAMPPGPGEINDALNWHLASNVK